MRKDLFQLPVTVVVLLIGSGIAAAGSSGGASVGDIPLFALVVALAFLIQIVAFAPAFITQTEHFFDLTGSLTYITLSVVAAAFSSPLGGRSALLVLLVLIWAVRLGTFLFRRVRRSGKDGRFDDIKPSFVRFLNVWVIQGLWVIMTAGAAWAAITSGRHAQMDALGLAGLCLWLLGFTLEVVADLQKTRFRAQPENNGRFISNGLWSWSRHPNYFGEILLWLGVAVIAFPLLRGWQLITLLSPVFVFLLITRVSGIPLLEARADDRWGGQEDYDSYKSRTSVLIPMPPRR